MSEERLIEIASTIKKINDPFVLLRYVISLNDFNMFFKYVKKCGYVVGNNYYDSFKLFADSYLKDKKISDKNVFLEEIGYFEDIYEGIYGADSLLGNDYLNESMRVSGSSRNNK